MFIELLPSVMLTLLLQLLPACPTEDSTNCYFDSVTGRDFADIGGRIVWMETR